MSQLDLFPASDVLRTERFRVHTRRGMGVVTAETRRPFYMTYIIAAPWDDALGLNWGRFMTAFGVRAPWEKVT